ncbi:LysR family transcriptional regulator [Clostridium sp. Marseille-P2415]|uniref:LysR family transcriptional regulator n=1 Tax=Clostridium sp. Marseille-P2415 TaxID=1805471 RepID=UPI0009883CDF|nr:LysR family transcriptional regulator [Clostridium sp. Marseille-P2415]
MNRYRAVVKIVETGGFTRAAEELGYTQPAVSQMVQSLEEELDTVLFIRSKKGVTLTPDGTELLPYIKNIYHAHRELMEKRSEMEGIQNATIRIGTFASVSCHWLPGLIKDFKEKHPSVSFELYQGDYSAIEHLVKDGSVDFGLINPRAVADPELKTIPLRKDPMLAVLPPSHRLAAQKKIVLKELAAEPFILLEEGSLSEPMECFREHEIQPNIQYIVHDDYTIMAMIEKGLGVGILSELILNRVDYKIAVKETEPPLARNIGVTFKDKKILPIASRQFLDFLTEVYKELPGLNCPGVNGNAAITGIK